MNQQLRVLSQPSSYTPPQVLQRFFSRDDYRVECYLPEDLPCFRGHFPSLALVPGVVQLGWVADFAGIGLQPGQRVRAERLKFQKPMRPGHSLTLSISAQQSGEAARLTFKYFNDAGLYASGILIVDPQDVSTLCCYPGL